MKKCRRSETMQTLLLPSARAVRGMVVSVTQHDPVVHFQRLRLPNFDHACFRRLNHMIGSSQNMSVIGRRYFISFVVVTAWRNRMAEYMQPDKVVLLDALPRSTRALDTTWCEIEAAETGIDEARALASWLLVVDHILGADRVGISLPAGWLELRVNRALSIAAWTDTVRSALDGPLLSIPLDAETAWGGDQEPAQSIAIRAGNASGGVCTIRFRTALLSDEGVRILATMWSAALRAPSDVTIEKLPWHDAVADSVDHGELWTRAGPLDVPSNFDAVLQRSPNSIAVVEAHRQWTYEEIDNLSHSTAHALLLRGIQPGEIVAIGLSRSAFTIVAMLGVLRAGAAYLPLDLENPAERLRYVVENASVRVLIADETSSNVCEKLQLALLDVSRLQPNRSASLPAITGDMLAYVMYTSGSTGQPKGVEVRHKAICRLVLDCKFMRLGDDAGFLHSAPLGFDPSTLEIWGPLLNGSRCIIHEEDVPTGLGMARTIQTSGAGSAWLTTSVFNAIVDDDARHLSQLDALMIGGEALSINHVKKFLLAAPRTQLINGYGPTETTYTTTHQIALAEIADAASVPIGRAVNATSLYVLNRCGEPLPRGLIGELYIGGIGVARGYLRRPELTAERFILDPFAADGSMMYRSGDQVRVLAGGALEFFGRIDGQVKIRGIRIETAEIEVVLSQSPEVRSCAVVAQRHPVRGLELVAYVVPAGDGFSPTAFKQRLGSVLPDYMVPNQWVRLQTLPVTTNGKLDRKKLPVPGRERPVDLEHPFVEPTSGLERIVAGAMAQALGIDRVGALDNFFDLGGNSLLVVRAHAALREAGQDGISVADFFAEPTPRAIARRMASKQESLPAAATQRGTGDEPIAVVGMAGRFPGAADVDSFWQMLCDGRETIKFFTPDELDASIPEELRRDSRYVAARGVIDDPDMFDATFFGISPREAELMDPQQRIFLEIAWECLERAGQVPDKTPEPIGVFAGMHNASYFANHVQAHPEKVARLGEFLVMLGTEKDYIATRTAHKLGLTGPAISVQTACSTSLVAIAQAFDALRAGNCGLALAGGASITCPPASGYLYQEGAMLSPDGHTRTFDAAAQGTVFSDGAAVVLLKRLSDAVADGNTVYAVIRSVSVNNDGAGKASFTAPSVKGQAALVRTALARANVDARSIDYVEAHGTATPLGDPIEVAALTEAYREHTSDVGFCAIGSVKSNTGHLVIAAGATGFIKTALSLHNETLPPTLHYSAPNPKIDLGGSPFVVNNARRAWPRSDRPRRAGVSSFGVGGTNAHVILEEAPEPLQAMPADGPQILRLSARSPEALATMLGRLADHLDRNPEMDLADIAHTLDVGRHEFAYRAAVVSETVAEATASLRESARTHSAGTSKPAAAPQTVMMFPGQGAQYAGMGRDLYARNADFRRQLDACFDAMAGQAAFDLRDRMFSDDPGALSQTEVTQPATFAIEYALASVWLSRGVRPAAMVGHSVGEFVAATLAGVLRLEDAVQLVARRGALMQSLAPGAMLSVRMSAIELDPLFTDAVQLAAENGPAACVVAGPENEINAFAARLEARGTASRRLKTSHAFHSAMMDPAVPVFEDVVARVALSAPQLPIVSTLTGQWLTAAEAVDPGYWARHMRQPVRFSAAVLRLLEDVSEPLFLETGPGSTLCSLVRQHRKAKSVTPVVASLGNDPSRELRLLTEAAGQLWLGGCGGSWQASPAEGRRRIVLPTYPFERQRHWVGTSRRQVQAAVLRLATSDREPLVTTAATGSTEPAPSVETLSSPLQAKNAVSSNTMSTRHSQLVQRLHVLFEDVSGIELEEADPSLSFVELGLDSLTLTQVALQLRNEFAVPVTFRQIMESYRSFGALAGYLDAQLPAEEPAAVIPEVLPQPQPQPLALAQQAPSLGVAHGVTAPIGLPMAVSDMPLLQQVIQQQMALMSQHLAILQGQAMAAVVVPAQSVTPQPVATVTPAKLVVSSSVTPAEAPLATPAADQDAALAHTTYDVKKAFGAIARIHTTGSELSERQRARLDAFIRRYTEKTQRSKRYTIEHRPHMADPRVVNGFRPQLKEIIYQIVIERSKGARVWDIDGNVYVDALNGFGMSMFGWQPDFVLEAVRAQLDAGYEIGPQHPLAGPVCKMICELTGFDRAGLCNTGSEAVMGCLRIARTVTGRSKIAMFSGAYHGIFDEVLVRGTRKGKAVPAAPGVMKSATENVVVLDYATPETLQWLKDNASDLAAVLVEPVQSRRPDLQPREFLQELRALTSASGALLIFDEVVTGFRSHPGGTQAIFGIQADIASYGKVVGGGYPIGVIAGKREFMDALDGGHWEFGDGSIPTVGVTYFAGTFVRHPLALVATHAVLELYKREGPKLQERLNADTAGMIDELNAFCREVGAPITLKHFSSVWKVFFDEDHPFQDLLFAMMRNRGIHILDHFPCFLTTAHDAEAIGAIKTAFKEAVAEMQQSDFLPRRLKGTVLAFDASRPPLPDARLGRDAEGKPAWFVANPDSPGKYIKVDSQ
jgi:amino acid adenylation domain-containing protein